MVRRGAVTLLGVHVARALHDRWRRLSARERARLEPLAGEVRERALDLRGEPNTNTAQRDLHVANERLADALIGTAEADPKVSEEEVWRLRDDLSRELARLADGEIQASSRGVQSEKAGAPADPSDPG